MIELVVDFLNQELVGLNVFKEIKGLCQYVQQDESAEESGVIKKFPAYYKGKDQLSNITDYDFRNGVIFHLKNGDVSIDPLESMRADRAFLKYTTPMKLIAIHSRRVIDDTAYTPDKVALNLAHAINDPTLNSLRATLQVNKIDVQVVGYSTDPEYIDMLFQNVDIDFKHELCIVQVDYSIIIEGYQACFINYRC